MRKKILLKTVISLFTIASCNKPLDEGSTLVWNDGDSLTLSFSQSKYQIERSDVFTISVMVNTNRDDASKKVNFSIAQDDNVISFKGENENTDGKVTLVGKNVGQATLIATSVDNPNIYKTVEIEVIKRIPALNKVWANINELDDYTFTTRKIKKSDSSDIEYSSKFIYKNNCIIGLGFYYLDDGFETIPLYEDGSDKSFILGYGIDKNDNAFEMHVDSNGNFLNEGYLVKSEKGFLNNTNFQGFNDKTIGVNDIGLFYGLKAINPSWLSSSKMIDNIYTFGSDDKLIEHCYLKYLLWGLIDPSGRYEYMQSNPSVVDFISLTSNFSITITATTFQSISAILKYEKINTSSKYTDYIYEAKLDNINNADISSFKNLNEFLNSYEGSYPSLSSELQLLEDGINNNDYVYERELYWINKNDRTNPYHSTFYIYYTPTYFMAYYSEDLVKTYYTATGHEMDSYGVGYIKLNDGIHSFEFDSTKDEKIIIDDVLTNTKDVELYNYDFNLTKDYWIPNYLSSSSFIKNHGLYNLSDSSKLIFADLPTYNYTRSDAVFTDFCDWYLGEEFDGNDFYTGVNITLSADASKVDSVSLFAAYSDEYERYNILYTPTLSSFGLADSRNVASSYIKQAIDDYE